MEECDDGKQCDDPDRTDCTADENICAGLGPYTCAVRGGDGCSETCELECGNGVEDPWEECDGGPNCTDCECDQGFDPDPLGPGCI